MNGGIIDRAERGTQAYSDAEIKDQIKLACSEYEVAIWDGTSGKENTRKMIEKWNATGTENGYVC